MNKAEATKVLTVIKQYWADHKVPADAWRLFNHDHHNLSSGSWTVTCEGYITDWPFRTSQSFGFERDVRERVGSWVFCEPQSMCELNLHDVR